MGEPQKQADFALVLEQLKAAYRRQIPEKRRALDLAWDEISQKGATPDRVFALKKVVHGLAGAGKTYGFPEITEVAARAETFIEANASQWTRESTSTWLSHFHALQSVLDRNTA